MTFVTVNKAAEMAGVCRQTILNHLEKGTLPFHRVEGAHDSLVVAIDPAEVEKFKATYVRPQGAAASVAALRAEVAAKDAELAALRATLQGVPR